MNNKLYDISGTFLREATVQETLDSYEAARYGGSGIIMVDGQKCFVLAHDNLVCVDDRWDSSGSSYVSVAEFLNMCYNVFETEPDLTLRHDGWYDGQVKALELK